MSALHKMRRRRMIVTALAIAWLPYVTVRCLPALCPADPACDVLEGSSEPHGHDLETGHHGHPGHRHEGPASTCCEVTGKSNVTLAAPVAFPDPQLLAALPFAPADMIAPETRAFEDHAATEHAHAPPPYLRNSTLRL